MVGDDMLVDIINLRLNSLYSELEKLNNAFSQSELDVRFQCEVDILDRESIFAFGRKYWKTLEIITKFVCFLKLLYRILNIRLS